jgi:hypothetical protein
MELNWTFIGIIFLGYWALCRTLRWRRLAFVRNKFKGRDPYSLTIDEAQWITHQFFQYEMPALARFSTAFALFRTYGIDSIAEILLQYPPPCAANAVRTSQLADRTVGGKRYADTAILISEFTTNAFDSDRHALALARVNWLHSHYNIRNDDLLYTLSVFVTCPTRWLERYDWRPLSSLENTVSFTLCR